MGENVFNASNDYKNIVDHIRNVLLSVQHTNIILCLPTFKYCNQANIFNRRIEMFNHLIYHDNLKYEYCYILDSNRNLRYSYDMFSNYNGQINVNGIKTILNDINQLLITLGNKIMSENQQSDDVLLSLPTRNLADPSFRA